MFSSIQEIRASEAKKLAQATAVHSKLTQLLDGLPEASPVPTVINPFGYCAEASIEFNGEGLVKKLLELYPPLPLVDVFGSTRTQKPVKYVRPEEQRDALTPLFPVLYKNDNGPIAKWWTSMPVGDVQVVVKGVAGTEGAPDKSSHDANSHSYQTGTTVFFQRKLAEVPVVASPLVAWNQHWYDYAESVGLNAKQRQFFSILKSRVDKADALFTLDDLPSPQYLKAGDAIGFGPGEDLVAGLEALTRLQSDRQPHWFDNFGDFWAVFDKPTVQAMLAFAAEQLACKAQVLQDEEKALADVKAALEELLHDVAYIYSDRGDLKNRVEHWLRKKTGLDVRLNGLSAQYLKVHAWARFSSTDRGVNVVLQATAAGKALLPQDIEVDYV